VIQNNFEAKKYLIIANLQSLRIGSREDLS
jgi:hypothetical protein